MTDAAPPDAALTRQLQQALAANYALGDTLGRGGFGVVFAARDLRLKRDVAVKVLRPDLAAPLLRERFRREAEATAGLRHAGIVPIYDIGTDGDLSWFVMPLIHGETLRAKLAREGRLPIGQARRILVETAGALAAAHAAGIIHRDIKPDNILLEGDAGRVILTDFGIAKSLGQAASRESLTTSGLIIGTPDYMSPEQAGGEATIDARTDLYSLGVVAFQMIAGERPFSAASPGGMLMQQLRGPAPALRSVRPECPAVIADTVDRCLGLERNDRWPSADALIAALERGSVPQPGAIAPVRDPRSGFRRLLAGAGLALSGAVGVDLWRRAPLVSPLVGVLAAALIAARYGTLWTQGIDWRGLLLRTPTGATAQAEPAALLLARGERAAILRAFATLPRVEQARVQELPARIDEWVARAEALAGQPGRHAQEQLEQLSATLGSVRMAVERARVAGLEAAHEEIRRLLSGS